MESVQIVEADLGRPEHQVATIELLDSYSQDPMGSGFPLPADVRERLIGALRAHPTTMVFLAYRGGGAVGLAICFLGFSTFAARTLINIHDLTVLPELRGQGIGRLLLEAVAAKGRAIGCCKLTLEVLENNPAKRLYESFGFAQGVLQPEAGGALYMAKTL